MIRAWALNLSGLNETDLLPVRSFISGERRERADRFRFEADRIRCIAAEGFLLYLLNTEYGIGPNKVAIEQDENGKPFLKKPEGTGLMFNLSHAGDWLVCALGDGCVGVDVEQVREADTVLAKAVMTPKELTDWRNMEESLRAPAFCRLWTLKESYSKFLGIGLSMEFSRVQMITEENGLLVPSGDDGCRLRNCRLGEDYFFSLCVEKKNCRELDRNLLLADRGVFLDHFRSISIR